MSAPMAPDRRDATTSSRSSRPAFAWRSAGPATAGPTRWPSAAGPDGLAAVADAVEGTRARRPGAGRQPGLPGGRSPHVADGASGALLIGQSGPHHFSAVVTVRRDGATASSIEVDVADRCRAPVEVLASTYSVAARFERPDRRRPGSRSSGSWRAPGPRLASNSATGAGPASRLAEAGRRATRVQALARLDPRRRDPAPASTAGAGRRLDETASQISSVEPTRRAVETRMDILQRQRPPGLRGDPLARSTASATSSS